MAALTLAPSPAAAEDASSLGEALTSGTVSASLRYRYEGVSEDTFELDAHASTLRLTLGYTTKPLHGVSLGIDFENVSDIGVGDEHSNGGRNGLSNGVTDRPVIPDPEITALQQVFVRVDALPGTRISAGRREIALGNERFVGPVGWRQHHQSFDAVSVENTSVPRTTLRYIYVDRVHRVSGESRPLDSHLANVVVELPKAGQLTLYGYWLDHRSDSDAGLSTRTLGGRFSGSQDFDPIRLLCDLELAHQVDAAGNPNEIEAGYFRGELGLGWRALTLRAGLEVLGAEPGRGSFSTPLATLHKWNGWADKFLRTPEDGLEDLYVSLAASLKSIQLAAIYHQFDSDTGGAAYGRELDLLAVCSAPWKQEFGVKLADYRARSLSSDTRKLWVWSSYRF